MRCEEPGCVNGWVRVRPMIDPRGVFVVEQYAPCGACGGTGFTHCCDGIVGGAEEVTNQGTVNPIATDKGHADLMTQREDLPALTGIRGLAAVTVVLHHYSVPGFGYGYLAVDLFFVLSGFVLAHVYRDGVEPLSFLRARAARTLPTHFVATMLFGAVCVVFGLATWPMIATALVGLSVINPPTWSLIVEWYAYLLFPVVAARGFVRRLPPSLVIAIAAVLAAGCLVHSEPNRLYPLRSITGLAEFAAGVALYRAGWRPRRVWLFDNRPVVWLGAISYPLYLIHELPMFLYARGDFTAPVTDHERAICIIASFALAVVLHHAVEVPGRRWLRTMRWPRLART